MDPLKASVKKTQAPAGAAEFLRRLSWSQASRISLRVMALWRLKHERRAASDPTFCSKYLLTPLDSWRRPTAVGLACACKPVVFICNHFRYIFNFCSLVIITGAIKRTCCRTVYMNAACPLVLDMELLEDAHRLLLGPEAFMMIRGVCKQQSLKWNCYLRYVKSIP